MTHPAPQVTSLLIRITPDLIHTLSPHLFSIRIIDLCKDLKVFVNRVSRLIPAVVGTGGDNDAR